ncbi:NAD-dependent epimerase/dehydratase family protein, partial [Singulisphaera rosea]
ILAANDPGSIGEAYNITNQGPITQAEFMDLFAEACGVPKVTRHVPYRVVFAASFLLEAYGRLTRSVQPPLISRYATWLMGRDLRYSTDKARVRLGWAPDLTYRESIGRSVRWFLEREGSRDALHPV